MKLPRSSYKILRIILLGYLHAGGSSRKAATLDAVARATGLNRTLVSSNNAGLADLGIIERVKGGAYALTPEGNDVARALEFEEPELIKRSLSGLLTRQEAVSAALNMLRVRGSTTPDTLANQLLLNAGEPKSASAQTGARAIIDLLELAGLVAIDGDRVELVPPRVGTEHVREVVDEVGASKEEEPEEIQKPQHKTTGLQVTIAVSLTSEDLLDEDRLVRLRAAIDRLTERGGTAD